MSILAILILAYNEFVYTFTFLHVCMRALVIWRCVSGLSVWAVLDVC